jgi:hypothetical protein
MWRVSSPGLQHSHYLQLRVRHQEGWSWILLDWFSNDLASQLFFRVKPRESFVPLTSLETAKKWFIQCCTEHKDCHDGAIEEIPTRLVKLSPIGTPKTTLLWSTAGEAVGYAALSYCWGGPQPFRTTTSVSSQYAESLPYASLPQTILDAFDVARNLDLQFIWVDSLCIIQDDEEDIKRELGKMSQVYQNAKLTMSAASASHCKKAFSEKTMLL